MAVSKKAQPKKKPIKKVAPKKAANKKPIKAKSKNKGGAPTKYNSDIPEKAYQQYLLGKTDEELATTLGVHVDTIHEWAKVHKEFSESRKRGKEVADGKVAASLFERALGFEHDSEEIKIIDNRVVRVPVKKKYPPEVLAAIFWLKNRQPEIWRDKKEISHDLDGINISVIAPDLDDDD